MVYVVKFDGSREKFKKSKIVRTCIRIGLSPSDAKAVADKIERSVYDGITTREIYRMILKEVKVYGPEKSSLYKLRESLSKIEPHIFETFVRRLLEQNGYKCLQNQIVEGLSIEHEIDVIAEKNGHTFLVECKHHVNFHRFAGLDVCLQVRSTLEDLKDGYKNGLNEYNFEKAWIFTNSKFSDHAKRYAASRGILLTGWKYPENSGIEKWIERSRMFPVTILTVQRSVVQRMMEHGLVTILDINEKNLRKLKIPDNQISKILKQKNLLLSS